MSLIDKILNITSLNNKEEVENCANQLLEWMKKQEQRIVLRNVFEKRQKGFYIGHDSIETLHYVAKHEKAGWWLGTLDSNTFKRYNWRDTGEK